MFHESRFDHNLNRLLAHFGPRIVGQPPAVAADLAALESMAGRLPRDLRIFLSACNGLRLELPEPWPYCHLWSIHDMLLPASYPGAPDLAQGFLPIAGNVDAQRDWVLLTPGTCYGAVLRSDPSGVENGLVASTFGVYFECWTGYVVGHFGGDGRRTRRSSVDQFDAEYVARHDPALARLQEDAEAQVILGDLHMALSAGADFE